MQVIWTLVRIIRWASGRVYGWASELLEREDLRRQRAAFPAGCRVRLQPRSAGCVSPEDAGKLGTVITPTNGAGDYHVLIDGASDWSYICPRCMERIP